MEHVRWISRPALHRPVVIAAFEGWNDAGDAASTAARWLRGRWAPDPMAEIDPEDFFDFTTTRPQVVLTDGVTREIEWPSTELTSGSGAGVDTVVVVGTEPQLRWRTFADQVVAVAEQLDARLVLTLGALLAEVPHTRPTSIIGTSVDDELIERHELRRSSYEGPTGIVGVLQDRCTAAGIPGASLWAAVPAYVPGAPSPKAALALVERTAELLAVPVTVTDLEIAAASYERQVTEVVVDDEEMTEYVTRLEARYAAQEAGGTGDELPSAASLVDEVERFLREQRD
ncbi:MAG TPA: PAC2 family protein [Acidimicrobiales bacterium]|nr:PAC2 family protein [Acidimicrobiales bacterium]